MASRDRGRYGAPLLSRFGTALPPDASCRGSEAMRLSGPRELTERRVNLIRPGRGKLESVAGEQNKRFFSDRVVKKHKTKEVLTMKPAKASESRVDSASLEGCDRAGARFHGTFRHDSLSYWFPPCFNRSTTEPKHLGGSSKRALSLHHSAEWNLCCECLTSFEASSTASGALI